MVLTVYDVRCQPFEGVLFRLYTRGQYTLAKDYIVGHTTQTQGRTKLHCIAGQRIGQNLYNLEVKAVYLIADLV